MISARRIRTIALGLLLPLGACGNGFVRSADLQGAGFAAASGQPAPWGQSLSGNYLAGRHADRSFDLGGAADYLGSVLAQDPGNLTLRQRVFLLRLSDGRFDESLKDAKALVEARAGLPVATLRLAVEALRKGNVARARELVGSLEPNRYQAFMRPVGLAWLALAGGKGIDAALAELEPLAADPGFGLLDQLHRGLLNEVAGRPEEARAAFEAVLQRDPTPSLRIAQILGDFFERHGPAERAKALYEAYRQESGRAGLLLPASGERPRKPLIADAKDGFAEAIFDLAGALYEGRDVALALVYARLAQALAPDNAMIALMIGEILESEDRYADAFKVYGRIDTASPFARAAALRMAHTLDEQDMTDKAVASLRALADANPADPEPLVALGHILRTHERFEEAAAAYDEALQRIGQPEPRHWRLLYTRGIALERSGRWERAEADLKKALEFEPEQPYVLNYLGYSWIEHGRNLEQAEKFIRRAVELRPNDGFIADSLGWVFYRTGRYEEAVEQLERAVALEPGDPVINEHLGDAYWKVGRRNEARFQWAHALAMSPEEKRLPEIRAKLQCGLGGCQARAGGT